MLPLDSPSKAMAAQLERCCLASPAKSPNKRHPPPPDADARGSPGKLSKLRVAKEESLGAEVDDKSLSVKPESVREKVQSGAKTAKPRATRRNLNYEKPAHPENIESCFKKSDNLADQKTIKSKSIKKHLDVKNLGEIQENASQENVDPATVTTKSEKSDNILPKLPNPVVEKIKTDNKRQKNRGRRSKSVEIKPAASNKSKGKRTVSIERDTRPISDYFLVRRSERRIGKTVNPKDVYEKLVLEKCQDGLEVEEIPGKGRGVIATRPFDRNEFIVEYAGELISLKEAARREEKFENDSSVGCYMYYFMHGTTKYCIDATKETGLYGRLLNHSRKKPNCRTQAITVEGEPKLILIASRNIEVGEELLYDYGDRSKTALQNHPWLAL